MTVRARLAAVRGWWGSRHLSLCGLEPGQRRLARAGLLAVTGAAVLGLVGYLAHGQSGVVCFDRVSTSPVGAALQLATDAVALLAIGGGLALVEVAGSLGDWRFGRLRLVLLSLVPVLVATVALLGGMVRDPVGRPVGQPVIVGGPLVAIAVLALAGGWRARRRSAGPWLAGVLLLPVVATLFSALMVGVFSGNLCRSVRQLHYSVGSLGQVAAVGGVALLAWLAFDGLRLSSDTGEWLLRRVPAWRLANGILLLKALVVLVVALAVVAGSGPVAWRTWVGDLSDGLIVVVPAATLMFVLFVREGALVGVEPDRFPRLARALGVATFAWLAPAVVLVPLPLLGTAQSRWPLVLLVVASIVLALAVGATSHQRRRWAWRVPVAMASVLVCCSGWWALSQPPRRATLAIATSFDGFVKLLAVSGVAVLVGLLVLSRTRWLREHRTYIYVVVLWLAAVDAVPLMFGVHADLLVLDVAVLAVGAILFLLRRAGSYDHAVSDVEIVLLLVTTTVLIEVPLALDQLPRPLVEALLIFAFLGPGLTTLALGAKPLNRPGPDRGPAVLATLGALCIGYGAVLSVVGDNPGLLPEVQEVTDNLLRSFTLPLAVVLAAAHSHRRRRTRSFSPAFDDGLGP